MRGAVPPQLSPPSAEPDPLCAASLAEPPPLCSREAAMLPSAIRRRRRSAAASEGPSVLWRRLCTISHISAQTKNRNHYLATSSLLCPSHSIRFDTYQYAVIIAWNYAGTICGRGIARSSSSKRRATADLLIQRRKCISETELIPQSCHYLPEPCVRISTHQSTLTL